MINPYPPSTEEYLLWEVLVRNDFEGFLAGAWEQVAEDYLDEGFFGIDFGKSTETANWKLGFPSLQAYKKQWIADSIAFRKMDFSADPRQRLYDSCTLDDIQINGDSALVHKLFAGEIPLQDGGALPLHWRSLFLMRKEHNHWRIAGFCGYINTTSSK